MAERKIRLRPIQATTQVDTNVPTGFQVRRPKGTGLAGPTREAQMAKALEQLNPSLINFASQVFEGYKEEETLAGKRAFQELDNPKERNNYFKRVESGELKDVNSPFWIAGYQSAELKELGSKYGLGLTKHLVDVKKTISNEEWLESINTFDQKFFKDANLSAYDQRLIEQVFNPRRDQFKAAVQQQWQGMRDQALREQRIFLYQQNISEVLNLNDDIPISTIDNPQWYESTLQVLNEGFKPLDDGYIDTLPFVLQNAQREKGSKLTGPEQQEIVTNYWSNLFDRVVEYRSDPNNSTVKGQTLIVPGKATQTPEFINKASLLNSLLNDYISASGNYTEANKTIIDQIVSEAEDDNDVSKLNYLNMLYGHEGKPLANTQYAIDKARQARNTIGDRLIKIENHSIKMAKEERDKAIDNVFGETITIYNALNQGTTEQRTLKLENLQRTLLKLSSMGTEGTDAASKLLGFISKYDDSTANLYLQELDEDIVSNPDITENQIGARLKSIQAGSPLTNVDEDKYYRLFKTMEASRNLDMPRSAIRFARSEMVKQITGRGDFDSSGSDAIATLQQILTTQTDPQAKQRSSNAIQAISEYNNELQVAQLKKQEDKDFNADEYMRKFSESLIEKYKVADTISDNIIPVTTKYPFLELLGEEVSSQKEAYEEYKKLWRHYNSKDGKAIYRDSIAQEFNDNSKYSELDFYDATDLPKLRDMLVEIMSDPNLGGDVDAGLMRLKEALEAKYKIPIQFKTKSE